MKAQFTTLAFLTLSLLAVFTARADERASTKALMVSNLSKFQLAPRFEQFKTQYGEVQIDGDRQTVKLVLDSQRGRFEVEAPIVAQETDVCGVITYRAQAEDGLRSLQVIDRAHNLCARGNLGIVRAAVIEAYLVSQDDGVQSVSSFEGSALRPVR